MDRNLYANSVQRHLFALLLTIFSVAALWLLPAPAAHAASCSPPNICGDIGGGGSGADPAPTSPTPPSKGSPPSAGGGTGTSVPSNVWSVRLSPGFGCPSRDDGKGALAVDFYYKTEYTSNTHGRTPPDASWTFSYATSNGQYFFLRDVYLYRQCMYPPRSMFTTVTCSIRYYVEASMVAPQSRSVGQANAPTGYSEGSYSYPACYNSKGFASLNKSLDEYGYYNVNVWQRVASARVEVLTTPNEVTGVTPAPRIVSLSPAYTTPKRTVSTASIDCQNGFLSPGVMRSDWTETPCQLTNNPSYTCQPNPILVDVAGAGQAEKMLALPNNTVQMMRDGVARRTVFSQQPVGSTIKVASYKTRFLRAENSTPWDGSKLWNKNLFELSETKNGGTILSQQSGTTTPWTEGKQNTVYATGYSASSSGAPTKVTQQILWSGTRTVRTGTITAINPNNGTVSWAARMRDLPTSGLCNQTLNYEYIRAIGDAVR